jgi:hypothetical protein
MAEITFQTPETGAGLEAPAGVTGDGNVAVVNTEEALKAHFPELKDKPEGEQQEPQKESQEDPKRAPAPKLEIKAAETPSGEAKVTLDTLAEEFAAKDGEVSDETRAALEAQGITRATAQTYINGLKAQAAEARREIAGVVGGETQLDAVMKWAATGVPKADIETYNKMLASGDLGTVKFAVEALNARYEKSVGSEGVRLNGGAAPASRGPQPFASQAEMVAAINDKRYETNPSYRAEVERRITAS